MKLKPFLNATIVMLCALALAFAESVQAPASYKLNAEASRAFKGITQRQAELQREFEQLELNKLALLIGAGVPADARSCAAEGEAIVCAKPKPSPTPTRTPSP